MRDGIIIRSFLAALLSMGGPAAAETCKPPKQQLAIPSGSLYAAITRFAEAFSYQVVVDLTTIDDLRVEARKACGDLSFWADVLLADRQLSYRLIDDTLVISRAPPQEDAPRTGVAVEPQPVSDFTEVLVVGRRRPMTETASQVSHYSSTPDFAIGYEEAARMGMTDLASVLELAAGVKMEQDRYMVIRGMHGRYQSVRLNGGSIPGLGPTQQSVPMDIFPLNILNHIDLHKSVYADAPGSSTAGMVNIETLRIPQTDFLRLEAAAGYRQGTTGANTIRAHVSDTDWRGADDGSRDLPALLTGDPGGGVDAMTPQQRETAGESIRPLFAVYKGTAGENALFNLSGGKSWERDQVSWGLTASAGYKSNWQLRQPKSQEFTRAADGDSIFPSRRSEHERVENIIDRNLLLAGGLNLRDDHHLGFNALWLGQATSYLERTETASVDGRGETTGRYQQRSLIHWTELDLSLQQVYGLHRIGEDEDSSLRWQVSRAASTFYRPFRTDYNYHRGEATSYQFGFGFDQLDMSWHTMEENTRSASVQWVKEIDGPFGFGEVKVGFDRSRTFRNGSNRAFSFEEVGNVTDDRALIEQPDPGDILTPEWIVGDRTQPGFILVDRVRPADQDRGLVGRFYRAENDNEASYLLMDFTLFDRWRLVQGLRQEHNGIEAELWDHQPEQDQRLQKDSRLLPSLSLDYLISAEQAVRLDYSQTVAWPGISELMPLEYEEVDTRVTLRGNPALRPADAENLDLQWSYADDRLNVKGLLFYKKITDAIEGVFVDPGEPHTVFNSYTFTNAENARVYGYEFEADLKLLANRFHDLNLSGHYARIYSRVDVDSFAENGTRPLQGQPEYVLGLGLRYQSLEKNASVSLLFKRSGQEIYITSGTAGVPPVYQKPHNNLHLSLSKALFDNAHIIFSVDNLLDSKHDYVQGGNKFLSYRNGTEYRLRIALDF